MDTDKSHLPRPHRQPAAEIFTVPSVVEFSRIVVVGQQAAMAGQRVHDAVVGGFGVMEDFRMDVLQAWRAHKGRRLTIRGDKEDSSIPDRKSTRLNSSH